MSAKLHLYWQTLPVYLIVAFLFFFVGLFIGWILWRHYRERATEIENENNRLREDYLKLKESTESLVN